MANNRQQLTEEQISMFQEVFSLYDVDEDGTIRTKDLKKVFQCLGSNFSKEEMEELTNEVDPRAFGVINFQQFLVMMAHNLKQEPPNLERRSHEVFKFFDVDKKGFITASDLKQTMVNLGENLTDKDVKQMIQDADVDEDGVVDYGDFIKVAASNG